MTATDLGPLANIHSVDCGGRSTADHDDDAEWTECVMVRTSEGDRRSAQQHQHQIV